MLIALQMALGLVFALTGALKLTPNGGPDAKLFVKLGLSLSLLRPLGWVQLSIALGLLFGLYWSTFSLPAALGGCAYFGWAWTRAVMAKPTQIGDAIQVSIVLMPCIALVYFRAI